MELNVPKDIVRQYTYCPKCKANPTEFCIGVKGQPRTRNHIHRVRNFSADVVY